MFQTDSALAERLTEGPGYTTEFTLSSDELAVVRDAIEAQWLDAIAEAFPEHRAAFAQRGIARYHELAHLIDHRRVWRKKNRMLPRAAVERIKQLPFLAHLREELGDFHISDVVHEDGSVEAGREEIYWRLVRPGVASDVGALHTDQWFHDVLGGSGGLFAKGQRTLKIWLPVYSEPGRNGLKVIPGSQHKPWRVRYVDIGVGLGKPQLDEPVAAPWREELMMTAPGNFVLFNERLLHGGAMNEGEMTRVSAEITLVFDPEGH
jgi:ectoine hydroxylase-related dioxygenase (phytanoyl-CoA dioxygenase family)